METSIINTYVENTSLNLCLIKDINKIKTILEIIKSNKININTCFVNNVNYEIIIKKYFPSIKCIYL